MALGADRAIHLVTDGDEWDPQATAARSSMRSARTKTASGPFDLVFFGNESADSGDFQVGIRVAYALGRPVATGLKGVAVEDGTVRCEQEVAGGRDVYVLPLPAVVTVLEGLNLPRYPSVPAKLRAQRKPLTRARRRPPSASSRCCVSSSRRARARRRRSSATGLRPHPPLSRCCRRIGAA